MRCEVCELSEQECKDMHVRLARNENQGAGLLVSAIRALQDERAVLGLKLATAAARFGDDPVFARYVRLQALEALGMLDDALDEAWDWLDSGGRVPDELWTWLPAKEAESGNLPGAQRALERALKNNPNNWGAWVDLAEVLLLAQDYMDALDAARESLKGPETAARGMRVIIQIAEDFYDRELYAEALAAIGRAGDLGEKQVELAWLRARIAALKNDIETTRHWLEVTLQLDPEHTEAQAAWEKVKPKSKKGWFSW